MSKQSCVEFLTQVTKTSSLKEKLQQVESPADIINLAREEGYIITEEEIREVINEQEGELNEQSLEAVAGGGLLTFAKEVYASTKKFLKDVLD